MASSVTGQAVVVNLTDGRFIFGLLTGSARFAHKKMVNGGKRTIWRDDPTPILLKEFGVAHPWQGGHPPDFKSMLGQPVDLALDELPNMVTFRDLQDPASLEYLDPKDFSSVLGAGVVFNSAVLEVTEDRVSSGIRAVIPWLDARKEYIDGLPPRAHGVHFPPSDFISE